MNVAARTRIDPPWWMAPHALCLTLMVPLLVATWLAPIKFHWELGRMVKFMDFGAFAMGLAAVFAFSLGAVVGARAGTSVRAYSIEDAAASPAVRRLLTTASWALFGISVAAYLIWFIPVLRDPSFFIDIVSGQSASRQIRETIGTIPGITTLVQAGVPYVALFAIRWVYMPAARPSLIEKLAFAFLMMLALMRNFIWSERIAVIELLVTVAVIVLRRPRFPRLTAVAPVFGFAGLFLFFSIFEYFRSWLVYYQYQYDSFLEFIVARLSGYYITALDNGAGLMRDINGVFGPINTAEWFWRFPIDIGQTWLGKALGFDLVRWDAWLYWYASPEFNNTSGLYMPLCDFGEIGGVLFWALFGVLSGILFRGFKKGSFAGLLLYATWFEGLLEIPRIFYLGQARYFPVLVIESVIIFLVLSIAHQEARRSVRPVLSNLTA